MMRPSSTKEDLLRQWRKILQMVTWEKGDLRSVVAYHNRGAASHIRIIAKSKEKGNKFSH
jgi:hypothetical protein